MINILNQLIAEADSIYGKVCTEKQLIKRASYKLGVLDAYNDSGQYADTADIRNWLGGDLDKEHYNNGFIKFKNSI